MGSRYSVAGGFLVNRIFVTPDLRRIFEFRRQKIAEIFSVRRPPHAGAPIPSTRAATRDPRS